MQRKFKILIIASIIGVIVLVGAVLGVLGGLGILTGGGSVVKVKMNPSGLVSGGSKRSIEQGPQNATTPTEYYLKLLAIYLAADVNPVTQNNVGNTVMIWQNPVCRTRGISNCNVDNVNDYFDFGRDVTAVNADLNAQAIPIPATDYGSYKYLRMEFCKMTTGMVGIYNMKAKASGWASAKETLGNNCGRTSAEMVPPLTVGSGTVLTLNVQYNLTDLIYPSSPTCTDGRDSSVQVAGTCYYVGFPDFKPSIS